MQRGARNVPLVTAIGATLVALVLVVIHTRVVALPGFDALEGFTVDARFELRGPRAPATDRIVIVGMDDRTREAAPWVFQTRRGYATLIDKLTSYGPKLVALDFFFDSPEEILPDALAKRVRELDTKLQGDADPALADARAVIHDVDEALRGDEVLADAIARSKRIVFGANFLLGGKVAAAEPVGLGLARHGEAADAGGGGQRRPTNARGVNFSRPELARSALGAGAVNVYHDGDGVVRRIPLAIEYGGREYMPLGLAVALIDRGTPNATRYEVGARSLVAGDLEIPLTTAASLPLDVLGPHQFARVSAADVLSGKAPREALAGKLVFVGHTYAASDRVPTPLDPTTDGVELHATLAENLLSGRLLRGTGWLATLLATAGLCGIVCLAQLRRVRRRAYVPPLVAGAALLAYVVLAYVVFARGTVIAVALPAVLTGVVVIAAMIGGLATEGREKAHLRTVFSQYVSGPVVDRILADPARAKLGGERKELTVLFSDIRGFSHVAEGLAPEELAAFLGEYLTPMTDLVLASGGTLDKYIGDAIMAIWGAPIDVPDHAARACEVALKMQEALAVLNRGWAAAGKPPLAIGIGINTGAMAVGNMGSAARFEYTVLGDQVNLGSRLEALTKDYGVTILVGEATARAAGGDFVFREIDLVRVKGRAGAAPVFELLGRRGHAVDPRFAEALAAYRRRAFAEANEQFAALAGDPVAAAMAARCSVLVASPPPDDWDGVYEQRSK